MNVRSWTVTSEAPRHQTGSTNAGLNQTSGRRRAAASAAALCSQATLASARSVGSRVASTEAVVVSPSSSGRLENSV